MNIGLIFLILQDYIHLDGFHLKLQLLLQLK